MESNFYLDLYCACRLNVTRRVDRGVFLKSVYYPLFEIAISPGSAEPERVDKSESRARMSRRYFLDTRTCRTY